MVGRSDVKAIGSLFGDHQGWFVGIVLHLLPESVNVCFKCVARNTGAIAPNSLQQCLAIDRSAMRAIEVLQDRRFLVRQFDAALSLYVYQPLGGRPERIPIDKERGIISFVERPQLRT